MMLQQGKDLYQKHRKWVPAAFFLLGFAFDAIMLRRIDEPIVLFQQAGYLLFCAVLISTEFVRDAGAITLSPRWLKFWKYRDPAVEFMLGTLLNSYTIFYFKSASAFTSLFFIAFLVTLLIIKEFKHFGESQSLLHMSLLSLCVVSYCVSLVPILLGFIGLLSFVGSIALSCVLLSLVYLSMRKKLAAQPELLKKKVLYPFAAVPAAFVLLYFAQLIPPVPLSISYMGVFHDIKKEGDQYQLLYSRPFWKFWQHGDQSFSARPGDVVNCFVRIYTPTRFKDQLQVRWSYYDPKRGWQSTDSIPMPISGGREEGYRGVTKKTNYQPGEWRVLVETMDNREIGRIRFNVTTDESVDSRSFSSLTQ